MNKLTPIRLSKMCKLACHTGMGAATALFENKSEIDHKRRTQIVANITVIAGTVLLMESRGEDTDGTMTAVAADLDRKPRRYGALSPPAYLVR